MSWTLWAELTSFRQTPQSTIMSFQTPQKSKNFVAGSTIHKRLAKHRSQAPIWQPYSAALETPLTDDSFHVAIWPGTLQLPWACCVLYQCVFPNASRTRPCELRSVGRCAMFRNDARLRCTFQQWRQIALQLAFRSRHLVTDVFRFNRSPRYAVCFASLRDGREYTKSRYVRIVSIYLYSSRNDVVLSNSQLSASTSSSVWFALWYSSGWPCNGRK